MPSPIEDYALIGDARTVALVGRDGSIDWWCAPRVDSGASFAALLGTPRNGRWILAPSEPVLSVERAYRPDTMILETTFTTAGGRACVIDFMPRHDLEHPAIIRVVRGESGCVRFGSEAILRFDYGAVVPWVRRHDGGVEARGGCDGAVLHSSVPTHGRDLTTFAGFEVSEGSEESFVLAWFPPYEDPPESPDVDAALTSTETWWRDWADQCTATGPWRDAMVRSLLTLKALTYEPTGGIVAAATTSLPEWIGSVRNWDYRYCWLRDATFTLGALLENGYRTEAADWSEWLRRAVAGSPDKLQIMYGVGGERRLEEYEITWLAGYEGSAPVRIGNAASGQFQLDVYGEVMDMMFHTAEALETPLPEDSWDLCRILVEHVARGVAAPRRRHLGGAGTPAPLRPLEGDGVGRHRPLGEAVRGGAPDRTAHQVAQPARRDPRRGLPQGWNDSVGSFTQYYGCEQLDASLLMLVPGRVPAARRPPDRRHHRGDRA